MTKLSTIHFPSEFYTLINDIWPILLIFIISIVVIRLSYLREKKQKFIFYKEFFSLAFIVYILLLFELVTNTDVQSYSNNFVPFKEIMRYDFGSKYFLWNVAGNILIFLPFGLAVCFYLEPKKIYRPFLITIITSLTIEIVQMFIGRSFDIDDIILNCIGGILGYLIYYVFKTIKEHLPSFLKSDLFYNFLTIILIILIILYCVR